MMRHYRWLVALACLASGSCSRPEPPKKIVLDTLAEAEPDEAVSCMPDMNNTTGQAFVMLHLDSAAARANRITINVVKQDSTLPVRAHVLTSSGSADCTGNPAMVQFRIVGEQSYIGVTVYAGTTFFAVNARRLRIGRHDYGELLNAHAYSTDDIRSELVWGDAAPGDMDNQRGSIRETYTEPDRTRRQPRGLP